MTIEYVPPRAATLHLGGNAWAHPDLEPLVRDLGDHTIQRAPTNPRLGDHEAIVESIRTNGVYSPVKVQRSTGYVLAGNHTYDAITDQGGTRMPWVWLDVDDDEARRIMLADNRTAELGGYDQTLLLEQVRAAAAADQLLAGTGYSSDDLAELERAYAAANKQQLNDPDDAPPAPADDYVPISQSGDVWDLGRHRLVCGDSTNPATFTALLGDDQAACVWTDPPYGIDIVGGSHALSPAERLRRGGKTIQNDAEADLEPMLNAVFDHLLAATVPGASWYVACPAGRQYAEFAVALIARDVMRQGLVWEKGGRFVLGRSDYHYSHEIVIYGRTPSDGNGRFGRGGAGWYGPDNETSVWSIPRPSRSTEHPTMKPVELVARALRNSTRPGELVLDPFGGSGTTLIACEIEDRTARLIELDPRYADVIARRYQNHTGTTPLRNGKPHDFTTT